MQCRSSWQLMNFQKRRQLMTWFWLCRTLLFSLWCLSHFSGFKEWINYSSHVKVSSFFPTFRMRSSNPPRVKRVFWYFVMGLSSIRVVYFVIPQHLYDLEGGWYRWQNNEQSVSLGIIAAYVLYTAAAILFLTSYLLILGFWVQLVNTRNVIFLFKITVCVVYIIQMILYLSFLWLSYYQILIFDALFTGKAFFSRFSSS